MQDQSRVNNFHFIFSTVPENLFPRFDTYIFFEAYPSDRETPVGWQAYESIALIHSLQALAIQFYPRYLVPYT